jgi:formylmethanofuran dehydrogenase subunit B
MAASPVSSPSSPSSPSSITRDWTCPFCPLLCDDLVVESRDDATLAAPDTDCPRLAQALACYGGLDAQCGSRVDGHAVDLDTALTHAARILSAARRPLFGGLATDVAGARALYTLAAGCGAILDHLHGDAMSAATLALQDRGAFFTTLSEVRSRADLVVFFGCRPSQRYPRFFTRALAGTPQPRELVFVGCAPDPAAATLANARVEAILQDADPFDTLALWSALSEGREASTLQDDGTGAAPALAALLARIAAARYTVLVYEPAALPGPHAALLIEALNRIVKAANRTARAGCFALGGDDGAVSVNQAVTWLSGLPLRTRVSKPARFAGTAPLDYDPYRYRTARLLAGGETDALLWVASFAPPVWPHALDPTVPAIVLGHPALAGAAKARGGATVFIPVATPGIDSGGHLFRVDGSVVMPLSAARGTMAAAAQTASPTLPASATSSTSSTLPASPTLPTVAAIAAQLAGHLERRPAAEVLP